MTDQEYLQMAIDLATESAISGEGGPFGALVVKDGQIIGKGRNRVTGYCDPTAHAEVVAIRDACQNLQDFQLIGCTIYSSCEPCPMCLGAIYWARPERLVFAATRQQAAQAGFDDEWIYEEVPLPIQERSLPTEHLHTEKTMQPFTTWKAFSQRTEY